jgi:hypothetical protein
MKDLEVKMKRRIAYAPLYAHLRETLTYRDSCIDSILFHVCNVNYLQILYTYKMEAIRALLSYYLEIEDYENCVLIRDTVLNHNKATGSSFKLVI